MSSCMESGEARTDAWQLAFRQTVADYGVDLAWTPMVRLIGVDENFR